MSSTKQRQELAKYNRQIKQLNETTATIFNQLSTSISQAQPLIDIRPAGALQLGVMLEEFISSYQESGDDFRRPTDNTDFFTEEGSFRTSYAMNYNGKDVGFIVLRYEDHATIPTLIEIVYVRPEFRGLCLGSAFYAWAITEKSAQNIELSYKRVRDNIAYWNAVGFGKFKLLPGQKGTLKALVILDTVQGVPLTPLHLKGARAYQNTHCIPA